MTVFETFSLGEMDLREEKYTKGTGFTNTLIGYRFKKDIEVTQV